MTTLHMVYALRLWVLVITLFTAPHLARAMTVKPPTFSELVDLSDLVVRGTVSKVESRRAVTPTGHAVIKTYVTLRVEEALKNSAGTELTLEFLGGQIGKDSLRVAGMPAFTPGATDYLFIARNGKALCPLVAAGHGRYRLRTDAATGRAYVAREDEAPLRSVNEISRPLLRSAPAAIAGLIPSSDGLTPAAFEQQIRDHVRVGATSK